MMIGLPNNAEGHTKKIIETLKELFTMNDSIPGYISPENQAEIDKLMEPYKNAKTPEERRKAREDINKKVTGDVNSAWTYLIEEREK